MLGKSGEVSVVVCTRNAEQNIEACIQSVLINQPFELIVVDGNSTDRTVARAHAMGARIVSDGGLGLAHARNVGLDTAAGRFVSFVGPDNVMPPGFLDALLVEMAQHGWSGVSGMTRYMDAKNFISRAMDAYKAIRFSPGERTMIGTPTLFETRVLRRFRYDDRLHQGDDVDLCERMVAAGHRFGIAGQIVYEIGMAGWPEIVDRWQRYGHSDVDFYLKYAPQWTWSRKLRSFLHPLRSELLLPACAALRNGRFSLLPFLFLITVLRYRGWICSWGKAKRTLAGGR